MATNLALLSALVLAAAPAPKPKYETFYPANVGTKWVYQDGDEETTLAVSAVDRKGGELTVSLVLVSKDGKTTPDEKLLLSEKGLFRLGVSGRNFDAPLCLVRFPHKDGGKWDVNISGPAPLRKEAGTATAVKIEEVTVPAGKYEAIRVEIKTTSPCGTPLETTFWFAPGVGLVKMAYAGSGERVLKSFTPAK
jgi:hypothetical protein